MPQQRLRVALRTAHVATLYATLPPRSLQALQVTQMYQVLLARVPTQVEMAQALGLFVNGRTLADQALMLMAANPAVFPGTLTNDAYVTKLVTNATGHAPTAPQLRQWSDQLGAPASLSRGALMANLLTDLTRTTLNADTLAFNAKLTPLLNTLQAGAKADAAAPSVANFVTANAFIARDAVLVADADAIAKQTPSGAYANEIAQLYLMLLGRAPDTATLTANIALRAGGKPLLAIAQTLLASADGAARFPATLANADFIKALFQLGLGRAADAAELTAWGAKLTANADRAQLAISLIADLYAYGANDGVKLSARTAFMGRVSEALTHAAIDAAGIERAVAAMQGIALQPVLTQYTPAPVLARSIGYVASQTPLGGQSRISVDRWGNVLSISDARDPNWKIAYSYNYNNQQLSQTLNSLTPLSAPASKTVYDALGRVVKTTDFNGNSNTQRYDSNGKMVQEGHADGGTITYKYNLFGDRSAIITARGQGQTDLRTDYTYDHLGHLTGTKTAAAVAVYFNDNIGSAMQYHNLGLQQLEERFEYDELGRKTRSTDGAGVSTYLSYDLDGNVISTMTQGNLYRTRTVYDALHHRIGTKDAMDHAMSWQVDSSGRISQFTDMSGAVTDYRYDAAGNRSWTSVKGNAITQTYENGLLVRIVNSESGLTTNYTYDRVGNRLSETQSYAANSPSRPARVQNNTLAYDMQNRLTGVKDDLYQLGYTYDNNGNRTSTSTKYDGTDAFTKYNAYDKMNRQTVVNADSWTGALNTSTLGKLGHLISYDQAGNRSTDSFIGVFINKDDLSVAKDTLTTESYAYDDVGRLQYSYRDGVKFETRNYDATGRVTRAGLPDYVPLDTLNALSAAGIALQMRSYSYDIAGHLTHQSEVNNIGGNDSRNRDIYFIDDNDNNIKGGYDAMGNLRDYTVTTQGYNKDDYGRYHIDYIWTDSAREHIVQQNTKPAGTTTSEYDSFGNRTKVIGTEGAPTKQFWYDADGHVQSKLEDGKTSFSLIVNGQMMGEENAKADNILGSTYQPASSATLAAAPSSYSVQSNSETLQSIAQAIWGDSKLWYLIADANGKTADQALKAGEILRIPSRVNTVHNDYATFNPYNASDAIGNTAPALPPPSHGGGGCGGMGTLIMVVVAVAVTVLTQGAAAGAIASFLGGSTTAGIVAVAADAALAAAAGSLASQAVGVAIGAQDGISWSAVRNAAVNSAGTTFLIGAPISTGDNVWAAAAQGALRSAVSQGVGMLANQQSSFNWRTVAAAAAGNALSTSVTSGLNDSSAYKDAFGSYAGLTTATLSGMSAGLTSALVRGGKIEVTRVATDAFGNALGSSLASLAAKPSLIEEKLALSGSSLQRAAIDEMTAGNEGSIPFTVDMLGQRSLRYNEGNTNYLSVDGQVRNYTNGFLTRDGGTGNDTFTAADMSSLGSSLSAEDYGYASKRLYNLSVNYDADGWWHDTKSTIGGWFGVKPTPIRTPEMEQERWELRQITAGYAGAHPEVWSSVVAGVDAAAGGTFGATAVLANRNRSYEYQQYAYHLSGSIDQGIQAYGSIRIAAQNGQALRSFTRPSMPGLEPISIRDSQTGSFQGSGSPVVVSKFVTVNYNSLRGFEQEFARQLQGQQRGINQLTAGEIKANIEAFNASGRPSSAASAINRYREANPIVGDPFATNFQRENSNNTAKFALLHDPDMVIGGKASGVTGYGLANVNSSLGAQNNWRQSQIYNAVNSVPPESYIGFIFKTGLP
ncbi:tRNA3(Ser)-specific nuclease WapA precursor [Duganella sp. HH105]|nr:tRNA3(Ser)-specific nuclease WapA precursor [Duganella sp. HH105]